MKIVITITDEKFEVDYVEPPKPNPSYSELFSDELVDFMKHLMKFSEAARASHSE